MQNAILSDLTKLTAEAQKRVASLTVHATELVKGLVVVDGRVSAVALEQHQRAAHALSWLSTYSEALGQMQAWAGRLAENGQFGEMEHLILQIGFGEYLAQIAGGIPMSQGEIARLNDISPELGAASFSDDPSVSKLIALGNTADARARLVQLMQDARAHATFGTTGLDDELEMIRGQFRRFANERIAPNAHEWHLKDELIPIEIIGELAEMGVF
ncbi:MAG: acyl-CoA dehydrogenase family protein, partial [Paracoccaceae bacterium]|nr:acyl-CoA dehydrogenase family protein [Paracoccaceae bacterium]